MPVVEDSIIIKGSPESLFALCQDYALRLKWDPFLREMRFIDAQQAAVGVQVWVRAWNGLTMQVEYITLRPPHVVAMKMTKGPFFFEKFAGSWLFSAAEGGATNVLFRYSFTTRWRWLQPLLDPIIQKLFLRDIRGRLLGLKRGAEEDDLLSKLCPA
jgi:ribosome-associated toxin RatA of RatAB toxin-antitoxin module